MQIVVLAVLAVVAEGGGGVGEEVGRALGERRGGRECALDGRGTPAVVAFGPCSGGREGAG